MGCGTSNQQVGPGDDVEHIKHSNTNGHVSSHVSHKEISSISNGVHRSSQRKTQSGDKSRTDTIAHAPEVPKSIAFNVTFGEDHPLRKPPPRKLQQLVPLNLPTLSATQLEEKQLQAEKKREQQLKKRVKSASKASRRRRDLLQAREFSQQQQADEIETIQRTAEEKRDAHLAIVKEKQRKREERARRARDRARRLKEAEQEGLSIDVERDMTYNTDDDKDSWLGDDEPAKRGAGDGRIRSPDKRGRAGAQARTPRLDSASTVDSCDAAFTRQKPTRADDFFDS